MRVKKKKGRLGCPHRRKLSVSGCKRCELFRCPTCGEVRPWDEGGTDDTSCAACWREKRKAEAQAAGAVCNCGAPAERILGPGARGPCVDYPNCGFYPIEVMP